MGHDDQELLELAIRHARLQEVVAATKFGANTLQGLLRDLDNEELLLVDLPQHLRDLAGYYRSIQEEKEPQLLVTETELQLRRAAISRRIAELEAKQ
jgi:hypothetical protein